MGPNSSVDEVRALWAEDMSGKICSPAILMFSDILAIVTLLTVPPKCDYPDSPRSFYWHTESVKPAVLCNKFFWDFFLLAVFSAQGATCCYSFYSNILLSFRQKYWFALLHVSTINFYSTFSPSHFVLILKLTYYFYW